MAEGDDPENPEEKYSRRKFLKTTGIAAAGLGLGSMASGLTFRSDKPFKFKDSEGSGSVEADRFELGDDGPAESFREIAGAPAVQSVVVKMESGTPTAYRPDGTQIAQDTDAGTVMQAAIDEVSSTEGRGRVEIGPGSYSLDSRITMKSDMTIAGAGMGATVFKSTDKDHGWVSEGGTERLVARDFTQDGDDQGNNTGIQANGSLDSWFIGLEVLNASGRDGSTGTTPALRMSGSAKRGHIHNCRVERSSSVSIETAIGAEMCEIVNCTIKNGVYNSGAGFVHGISVEKSKNCRVQGCLVEGSGSSGFSPALNVNNASYCVCEGNTVRNVAKGLINSNGPCYSNVYANNSFYDCHGTAMEVKSGNAGGPHGTMLIGNLIDQNNVSGDGISLGDGGDADIAFNTIRGADEGAIHVRNVDRPPAIVGNVFQNCDNDLVNVADSGTGDPMLFANNFFAQNKTTEPTNEPVVKIDERFGVMSGNIFNSTSTNSSTVKIGPDSSPSYWTVSNNYIRSSKHIFNIQGDGQVTNNVFDGKNGGGKKVFPGDKADIRFNQGLNGASLDLPTDSEDGLTSSWTRSGTYTGDGSTGRSIHIAFDPDHVHVQGSDGTVYDVHSKFGTGFQNSSPNGELSIVAGGFKIGDNGSDADPNTDGESYKFYAR